MSSAITTPIAAPTFNGTSTYASSLQQAITKAVSMASAPMQELEDENTTTQSQIAAAQSLETQIEAVNSAIQTLANDAGNSLSAQVSDPTVLSATTQAGALPGTYTVQVQDPGSYSTSLSDDNLPTVTDPTSQSISQSSTFTLTVDNSTYTIQPTGNDLNDLANAINASGAGVQATVINIGGTSQPDYRLALQSTNLGQDSIQLNDGTNDLMNTLTTGSDAVYTVNGQPTNGISSTSSTVTIAPGLTVDLEAAGTATIQVAVNTSGISSDLSAFVTAFNNAQAELAKSYGQNAGALSGDSVVPETSQTMAQIAGYLANGNVTSLASLGVTFNQDGTLSYDPTALNSVSATDLQTFLGSPTTGGFLASATNSLNSLLDPSTGLITGEITNLNNTNTSQQAQIANEQTQVTNLQNSIIEQMNTADALIAQLQNQTNFLTQLFQTENANNMAGQ